MCTIPYPVVSASLASLTDIANVTEYASIALQPELQN